jgi:Tfp pilus assembly protein PilF
MASRKKKKTKKAARIIPVPRKKAPRGIFFVLLAAFLIKLLYLFSSRQSPFYEPLLLDPAYYHQWALKIAHGQLGPEGVFYGLPLYPYFVGLCYKIFSESVMAVKLVQIFLGLVTLYFIYRIGEKTADERTGLLAASLAAFYGPLFFHEQIFIPEALSLPLYAIAFFVSLLFAEKPTLKKGLLLGVLFGLAALTKAGVMLFAFLFLAGMLFAGVKDRDKTISPVLCCFAAFILTLAPVTAHNLIRGHDKVLLTAHSGFNFYIGNNPKAEGVFMAPEGTGTNVEAQMQDSRAIAEQVLGKSLKASEVSKFWSDKAWDFIRHEPGRFFRLCGKKLLLFFDAREISDVDDYNFCKTLVPFLKFPWLDFTVLGPLLFLGVASSRRLKHRGLVYLWIVSYLAGLAAFFINARYRLPLLSVFFPVAAFGIFDFYERIKRVDWMMVIFLAGALAAGVYVGRLHLVEKNWAGDYVNAGDAVVLLQKDYDKALEYYKEALRIDPDSSKANLATALTLTKTGRDDDAKEYYLRSIAASPDNSQAYNNLGLWYDRQGDLETAQRHFLKAIDLKPNSAQAHNNLGMVYGKKGENGKAIAEFETSLKLDASNPRTYTNLGLVLYRLGQKDKARALWEKSLSINPEFEEAKRALDLLKDR